MFNHHMEECSLLPLLVSTKSTIIIISANRLWRMNKDELAEIDDLHSDDDEWVQLRHQPALLCLLACGRGAAFCLLSFADSAGGALLIYCVVRFVEFRFETRLSQIYRKTRHSLTHSIESIIIVITDLTYWNLLLESVCLYKKWNLTPE